MINALAYNQCTNSAERGLSMEVNPNEIRVVTSDASTLASCCVITEKHVVYRLGECTFFSALQTPLRITSMIKHDDHHSSH